MADIASWFMSLSWPDIVAMVGSAAGFIGWIVTCIIQTRQYRQLRLQHEKAELEIKLLKLEVARRGIAISIPTAEELDAALRDRAAFRTLKTLGKVSDLTRASVPDPAYEQYCLEVRRKVRKFMIRLAMGGAAVACSVIAIALWW